MTAAHILQMRSAGTAGLPRYITPVVQPAPLVEANGRRAKIWEISPSLHCSIVGTCLSAAELRRLLVKFGDADTRCASDHTLHKQGVLAAGRQDKAGKALHKLLDTTHETTIKQFAKAGCAEEVRELWLRAFDQGAIPGGYWAMMTHPATDRTLVEEAFGQIHMLSHLIGSSNRMDIRRLRELETELADRDEKIERQQARLVDCGDQISALKREIERLGADLRAASAAVVGASPNDEADRSHEALSRRLDAEKARSGRLLHRVEELETELARAHGQSASQAEKSRQLEVELASVERLLARPERHSESETTLTSLGRDSRTILYVGGRPGLAAQLRLLCDEQGVNLLVHDGGIEESLVSLPGLASRADIVAFPVDCISHSAVGALRKACRDGSKVLLPLRTASVASFVAGIASMSGHKHHSDGCC